MRYKGVYLGTLGADWPARLSVLEFRIREAIGRIMPLDYGKQVYEIDRVISVENTEQRDARLQGAR